MAVEGVDYAWSRPSASALKAAGKVFACRYGGPGSAGKQLDAAEAAALNAEGIAIVANAEGAADGMLGGWNVGVAWARDAEAHFRACGMPAGRPIYFSADFDVEMGSQWVAVANALRGAASVIGLDRVGIYGGRWPIQWARSNGVAKWFWQTYAWSSGVWVPGNHIEQYRNGVTIGGTSQIDLDRALVPDFGQWVVGGTDMFEERDRRIISNAYQVLYEEAYEHDPIKWVTNVDTGTWVEIPNLPLRRQIRIEQKIDALTALVRQMAEAGGADMAPVLAALAGLRDGVEVDTRTMLIELAERGAQGLTDNQG